MSFLNIFRQSNINVSPSTSKVFYDVNDQKVKMIEELGEDSFEVQYLQDFIKTEDPERDQTDYLSFVTVKPNFENMILVKLFDRSITVNFDYISRTKVGCHLADFKKILFEADEEVQKCIKQLDPAKTDYCVYLRSITIKDNLVSYQIGIYTDYDLSLLKCYLSEKYRLKYIASKDRQDALIFTNVNDICSLSETGKGSLLVHCNNRYGGDIGEIGVRDAKTLLPYYFDLDRYLITCKVVRKISGRSDSGAEVWVQVYDNPLHVTKENDEKPF